MTGHRHGDHGEYSADTHFSNVGWNNVTVEIIETSNSDEELKIKEEELIIKNRCSLMLNKHFNSKNDKPKSKEILDEYARLWSEDSKTWIIKIIGKTESDLNI